MNSPKAYERRDLPPDCASGLFKLSPHGIRLQPFCSPPYDQTIAPMKTSEFYHRDITISRGLGASLLLAQSIRLGERKEYHLKRLTGIALGIASIVNCLFIPCFAQGATEETMTFDVALDCRTFKYSRGVPLEQIVPGDGYILSGKIFPAGTLRLGAEMNDPNAAGSIGTLVTRGTTNATLAERPCEPELAWRVRDRIPASRRPGRSREQWLVCTRRREQSGDRGWLGQLTRRNR